MSEEEQEEEQEEEEEPGAMKTGARSTFSLSLTSASPAEEQNNISKHLQTSLWPQLVSKRWPRCADERLRSFWGAKHLPEELILSNYGTNNKLT